MQAIVYQNHYNLKNIVNMLFRFSLILVVTIEVKQKSDAFHPDLMHYVKFYSMHLESDVLHRIPVVSL